MFPGGGQTSLSSLSGIGSSNKKFRIIRDIAGITSRSIRRTQPTHAKSAFTLAEVLITLGIIGVVAAMTLPTIVNKYKKKITESRLKQSFSIMNEAVKLSELKNGSIQYWDYSQDGKDFYESYLKNFFKSIDSKKIADLKTQITYKSLSGTGASNMITSTETFTVKLSNGSMLLLSSLLQEDYKMIAVDVNGTDGPNTLGKDLFYFVIHKDYGFMPYGYGDRGNKTGEFLGKDYTREELMNGAQYTRCNSTGEGHWCALLIYTDGWEIKDDYPW